MDDVKPFLIRHADGREYELAGDDVGIDTFIDQYKPQGFAVVAPAPTNYAEPDFKAVREARKAASESEHAAAKTAADEATAKASKEDAKP